VQALVVDKAGGVSPRRLIDLYMRVYAWPRTLCGSGGRHRANAAETAPG